VMFWACRAAGDVPPSPVEKHHSVCAFGDAARDFVEVELHHVGVGIGKRQGRSDASRGADRAEQIGVVITLVGGLPWPCSPRGPLPSLTVLLADAGLVLEPDFDRRRLGQAVEKSLRATREVSLKALDDPFVLSRMTRPGADVREAKLLQKLSDIARMKVDADLSAMTRLRSSRRQRTTPSFSRSGPASTICAN
jgi:hypothetical protein